MVIAASDQFRQVFCRAPHIQENQPKFGMLARQCCQDSFFTDKTIGDEGVL